MHTNNNNPAWLQVDLLAAAIIDYIIIYNRNDYAHAADRLRNVRVDVSNDETFKDSKQLCTKFEKITDPHQIQKFECVAKIKGRYVRLSMNAILHICEMQVYGYY